MKEADRDLPICLWALANIYKSKPILPYERFQQIFDFFLGVVEGGGGEREREGGEKRREGGEKGGREEEEGGGEEEEEEEDAEEGITNIIGIFYVYTSKNGGREGEKE